MTLLFEATLNPGQVERFVIPDEWSAVAIATDSEASLPVIGHSAALSGPDGTIKTGSVLLDKQNTQLLRLPNIGHPNAVEVSVNDWVRKTATITIHGLISANPDELGSGENGGSGESGSGAANGSRGNLLQLNPVPNPQAVAVGPGRVIFNTGTVNKGWNENRSQYTLSTTVTNSEFWRVGFRSVQTFSQGRLSFGSGVGLSVIGLAPSFNIVDFELTQWGFYIASATEVRVFEFRDGAIANVAQFPWNPARNLAFRIDGETVYYEMLIGNDWQVVFTSNHTFTGEHHLVGTLGPQAFVFNVIHEEL